MTAERRGPHKPRASPRVPLRYRVPNPPPVFVGRVPWVSWMRTAVERAPVTAVWGLGGLGKTALVLRALHAHFPEAIDRGVFVGLHASDPKGHCRVEVARALLEARPRRVDWPALLQDPAALTMAALDLAEEGPHWIVLDDAHYDDPAVVHDFLTQIARYARRSRWLVTSRLDPKLIDLPEQVLQIPPMPRSELEELARSCAPNADRDRIEAALANAGGSPWRVRQGLSGRELRERPDALGALSPESVAFVEALSLLRSPLSLETVELLVPVPPPSVLEELSDGGFLERTPTGWRLHDVARPMVQGAVSQANLQARTAAAAEALASSPEPLAALESLRLYLEHDAYGPAAEVLARRGEELLQNGHALMIHDSIKNVTSPELARWQLRCATVLGDVEAVLALPTLADETPRDQELRARAYLRGGGASEALPIAELARSRAIAEGETEVELDATILRTACLAWLGRLEQALDGLRAYRPSSPDAAMLCSAHIAGILAEAGHHRDAVRLVADITPAIESALDGPADARARESARVAARALNIACHLRGAIGLLDLAELGEGAPLWSYDSRVRSWLRLACLVGMARLTEAGVALGRLDRLAPPGSILRPYVIGLDVERRLAEGSLLDLDERIGELEAQATALSYRDGGVLAATYRVQLATLAARECSADPGDTAPTPSAARMFALIEALYLARRTGEIRPIESSGDTVEAEIIVQMLAAHEALLAGDAQRAAARAERAMGVAHQYGWGVLRAQAMQLRFDALRVGGRVSEALRIATELGALAGEMPSPRFHEEARLCTELSAGRSPDPATLEELARLGDVAPVAARRAAKLLGEEALLDRVDVLVLDAVTRSSGGERVERVGTRASGPGWGLDDSTSSVWLPGGRRVDLRTRKRDWRILTTLAEHGGRASKEELVRGVWGKRDYHPLRDDKRLQVAIRCLRLLIEDEPSRPTRIVTLEDGYAFGESEPVRRARS